MRWVWVVIPLVLIGIVGIQESFAEENSSIIYENDLEFSVITDKKNYSNDELIHVSWQVQNVGSENFEYQVSGCGDGFSFNVIDSELHKVNGKLEESAKLIRTDDPIVLKFQNSGFYGNILQEINDKPEKTRIIQIFTSDGVKLTDIINDKFNAIRISEPREGPDAVGVEIAVKDIPEIASLDLVNSIAQGDSPVCTTDIRTIILEPNRMIEGDFTWSQLVHVKDNHPQQVPDGNYSAIVRLYPLSNCVVFGINSNSLHSEIPCFEGIPSSVTQEEYEEYAKEQLSIIEHPSLREELRKNLELLTEYADNSFVKEDVLDFANPIELNKIQKISSPKQQITTGISHNEIKCKEGLQLIFKSTDGSPACVKLKTAEKLIQRGWTSS